jgi:hypothetical protein
VYSYYLDYMNWFGHGQCCFRPWRLAPFGAAGAAASALAAWAWGCFWAPPQQHAAALESLAAGAAVTGDEVFAGSLIMIVIRFCLFAAIQRSRESFSQETCHPAFAAENKGKALRCNRMRRKDNFAPCLREFATWNFSKANCEFSSFSVSILFNARKRPASQRKSREKVGNKW